MSGTQRINAKNEALVRGEREDHSRDDELFVDS
jgi:hypothetical protein